EIPGRRRKLVEQVARPLRRSAPHERGRRDDALRGGGGGGGGEEDALGARAASHRVEELAKDALSFADDRVRGPQTLDEARRLQRDRGASEDERRLGRRSAERGRHLVVVAEQRLAAAVRVVVQVPEPEADDVGPEAG